MRKYRLMSPGPTPVPEKVLLKMADTAMYEAKKIGRNNLQFYSSAMSNKIKDRLELENALRGALNNNEFFLVFQPQVNLHTRETTGFEALVRWKNPDIGFVPPDKFIPILEDTGLIYAVGEWIIQEALNFIKSGQSRNKKVSKQALLEFITDESKFSRSQTF